MNQDSLPLGAGCGRQGAPCVPGSPCPEGLARPEAEWAHAFAASTCSPVPASSLAEPGSTQVWAPEMTSDHRVWEGPFCVPSPRAHQAIGLA